MRIKEAEFVVFDVETTGLKPEQGDKICEIGAVKVKGSKVVSSFTTLVNPQRPMPIGASSIHGITEKDLEGAPLFSDAVNQFLEFIDGLTMFAYNISFDLGFVNPQLRSLGHEPIPNPCIDILAICKKLLGSLPRFTLSYVSRFFDIPQESNHRALQDSAVAAQVILRLMPLLEEKGILTLDNLYSIFGSDRNLIFKINNVKISIIRQALADEARLKIKYYSLYKNELTEREVLPIKIESAKDRIFLVGKCFLRDEERNFNIDGILDLAIV
jgi:DNA polymerase III epsilon subunit family exonuclease